MRGGAFGGTNGTGGQARGACAETTTFEGRGAASGAHAPNSEHTAPASKSERAVVTGFFGAYEDDCRYMKPMELLSSPGEVEPALPPLELQAERSGAPTPLDWIVTLAGVWIVTGLFIDAHQHLFLAVESFLNPWHMTMYSGAIFSFVVLGMAIARNYRTAGSFWKAVPFGYSQSVVGVAALLVGGALDFVWHSFFGFEHQLDLLLSPPHLFLLTGLFFLITGPVRSGLARPDASNLLQQLPMLISLGLAFEILQFVTQYGFYPEALMRDHPLPQAAFAGEQFVLSVFLFYRQALEIAIVIWQSLLLAAAALYLCAHKRLCFGALAVLCVAEKLWIGGELSSDAGELALVVLASLAAGLAGDAVVARLKPSVARPNAFRILAFIVPAAYFGAYFAFAVPLFGGTWWDQSFVFGSIVEAGLVGICIAQLFLAGSPPSTSAST